MTLSDKAQAFLKLNPVALGTIGPVTFYEHPVYGDESPMYFLEDGKLRRSEFWDMDSAQDSQWNNFV